MLWTVDDVDKHVAGLTPAERLRWVKIANAALERCNADSGANCNAVAIRTASGMVSRELDVRMAESLVDAAGELRFWRELTPREREFGDIPRVKRDFDEAERKVAAAGAPIVRQAVRDLVAQANHAIALRNHAAIVGIEPIMVHELQMALTHGVDQARTMGRQQIYDAHQRQVKAHTQLATKVRPPKQMQIPIPEQAHGQSMPTYYGRIVQAQVDAKIALAARKAMENTAATVRDAAVRAMVRNRDEITDEEINAMLQGETKAFGSVATSLARSGLSGGRIEQMDAVRDDIKSMTYSAVMDENTCDVCEAADGDVYEDDTEEPAPEDLPPEDASADDTSDAGNLAEGFKRMLAEGDLAGSIEDGIDAAPNPDCVGEEYGNACRCIMVIEF